MEPEVNDNDDKSKVIPVALTSCFEVEDGVLDSSGFLDGVLDSTDLLDSTGLLDSSGLLDSTGLDVSVFEVSALLVSFFEDSSFLGFELSVLDLFSELSAALVSDFSSLLSVLVTSLTTLDSASEISDSADSATELSAEL